MLCSLSEPPTLLKRSYVFAVLLYVLMCRHNGSILTHCLAGVFPGCGCRPWIPVFCRDVGGGFVFVWLFGVGVAFAFLGVGVRRERDGPAPLPLPWVPAKAGTTVGVGGPARAAGVGGGVPLLRDGRFANRPYDGVLGERGCGGSGGGGGGSRLRGNDGGVRVGDGGRGRRPRPAPLPWVPAFAGTTRAGGPSTGSGRTESRGEGRGGVTWGG